MRTVTGDSPDAKENSLKTKLADQIEKGAVSVSSSDLADFGKKKEETGVDVEGPVTVSVPDMGKKDPLAAAADGAHPERQLQDDMTSGEATHKALANTVALDTTVYGEVTLTQAEREDFVESLISGGRFELPFSLYGGKLTGVVRARSQAESTAIIRYLNQELRSENVTDMLEYSTHLRNILLAAQIKECNGATYPELKAPLMRTVDGKETKEPGWLEQMSAWADQQEGMSAAIYNEVRKFEQKYWAMIDGAEDQNFLNPEESTSE